MALNYTKTIVAGNITHDLELRQTEAGKLVLHMTLAINGGKKDNPIVTFVECVAWERNAEFIAKHFTKGSPVFVEGHLRNRITEVADGRKYTFTYVEVDVVRYVVSSTATTEKIQSTASQTLKNIKAQEAQPNPDDDLPF